MKIRSMNELNKFEQKKVKTLLVIIGVLLVLITIGVFAYNGL